MQATPDKDGPQKSSKQPRFVRFQIPFGASPEEMVRYLQEIAEKYGKAEDDDEDGEKKTTPED